MAHPPQQALYSQEIAVANAAAHHQDQMINEYVNRLQH